MASGKPAAHDGVAAIKIGGAIEQMHRAAASAAAPFLLPIHFGEHLCHRHAAHKRLPMLPIGRDDPVALLQHGDDAHRDRLLSVVKVKKAADLLLGVEFGALVLELTDADHLLQQVQRMLPRQMRLIDHCGHRSSLSSVEISPSGRPSSRALSRRRMILPLRVFGRFWRNAMSFGATAGPRRYRAWPSNSLRSASRGLEAALERDEGLDHFAGGRVRNTDHARLGNRRVLHQRAFHLERADEMAGALDDIVSAADEPVIALLVAHREVAGEIPARPRSICGIAPLR